MPESMPMMPKPFAVVVLLVASLGSMGFAGHEKATTSPPIPRPELTPQQVIGQVTAITSSIFTLILGVLAFRNIR